MDYPEIQHHGAAGGVTGTYHQLLMDAQRSLLNDCVLFQGAETSVEGKSADDRLAIEFPLYSIKVLVATYVHIDYVWCIPYLLAAGFKGPILCSEPSSKLLPTVLDSPLGSRFTQVFLDLKPYWDNEALQRIKRGRNPMGFEQLQPSTATRHIWPWCAIWPLPLARPLLLPAVACAAAVK